LPHIEPSQDSVVRNEVSAVTAQYRDLLSRANGLSDRLSGVGGRQREYRDALDKARAWLREAEPRATKVLAEPIGAEPKTVEEQLNKAKTLNNEFVAQGRLIDAVKQVCFFQISLLPIKYLSYMLLQFLSCEMFVCSACIAFLHLCVTWETFLLHFSGN